MGDGGEVDTFLPVQNIYSTGALGDIQLRLGKAEVLQSITAPSIFGNINLYGGTLTGTLQTTGEAFDNNGQSHAVGADLGAVNNGTATELDLVLASTAKVVSRGNLFSHVQIQGNFNALIAANGDIGQNNNGARTGGITITGKGNNTGQIIALGNIEGDVTVAGKLSGKIAAHGRPAVGATPNSPTGILGDVTVTSGLTRSAAILTAGQIGDAGTGTILTLGKPSQGLIAAAGGINLQQPTTGHPKVGSSPGQVLTDSAALDNLWTPSLDSGTGDEDLGGLKEMEQNVNQLKAGSNGALT